MGTLFDCTGVFFSIYSICFSSVYIELIDLGIDSLPVSADMTPLRSTNFSAYPRKNRASAVGESVGDSSSGNLGTTPKFMVRRATNPSLLENPRSLQVNDVPHRHAARVTEPVLSIAAGRGNAPTELPWRCASEQLADLPSTRISPVAVPEIAAYPHSSDDATFDVGRATEIIPETDSQAGSTTVGAYLSHACLEDLMHVIDDTITTVHSMTVSDAGETIPREGVLAEASDGSQRCRDTRLEEFSAASFSQLWQRVYLSHAYLGELIHVVDDIITTLRSMTVSDTGETIPRESVLTEASDDSRRCRETRPEEFSRASFRELLQRGVRIQEPLQSVAGQSSGSQPGTNIPSGNGVKENVANGSATAGLLAGEQKKPGQAQSQPPQHTAGQKEQEDGALCRHFRRRCYVRFPCCSSYFACHRCHNEARECDNTERRAKDATHLKCAECHTEQVITKSSHHCSACKIPLSEYFCGKCNHFTCKEKHPYHCDKCGICRIHEGTSFHCDVCNVCLDKRLQGRHKCRPDSEHDRCCICLEDTFSGCQILPCSHKVHRECEAAMIQNRVRTCPICRHPISTPYRPPYKELS